MTMPNGGSKMSSEWLRPLLAMAAATRSTFCCRRWAWSCSNRGREFATILLGQLTPAVGERAQPMTRPPLVLGLTLCEDVVADSATQNDSVIRSFTGLALDSFPAGGIAMSSSNSAPTFESHNSVLFEFKDTELQVVEA